MPRSASTSVRYDAGATRLILAKPKSAAVSTPSTRVYKCQAASTSAW
jgi:hypothetical protein